MGSGFSACGTVSVRHTVMSSPHGGSETRDQCHVRGHDKSSSTERSQSLLSLRGQSRPTLVPEAAPSGLSDSCDSGIFEGNWKRHHLYSKSNRGRNTSVIGPYTDRTETKGSSRNCNVPSSRTVVDSGDLISNGTFQNVHRTQDNHTHFDTRYNRPMSKLSNMNRNPRSELNLLQAAISEVDEDEEAFAIRMSMPKRPKSAHARRKRGGLTARTGRSAKLPTDDVTDGESSEISDQDDFDSDILSIPDETLVCRTSGDVSSRSNVSNVKLGPKFEHIKTNWQADQGDWWTGLTPPDDDDFFGYQGHGSFTSRLGENGFAKKASERSLSSVILLSPVEVPDVSNNPSPNLSSRKHPAQLTPRSSLSQRSAHTVTSNTTHAETSNSNLSTIKNTPTTSPLTDTAVPTSYSSGCATATTPTTISATLPLLNPSTITHTHPSCPRGISVSTNHECCERVSLIATTTATHSRTNKLVSQQFARYDEGQT